MAGDKETLLSMGFDPARVEWALKATGNRGLQPAMDHILENEGKPVPELGDVKESTGGSSNAMDVDEDEEDREALESLGVAKFANVEAKSIKCSECGKIFKNTALANYHAEKSGHDQFEESTEEIKPLTEEEKKQKLEELRAKMAEKRAKRAAEEAKEAKANELIRRKQGKDLNKIKEELKVKEALKEAEAKKREKIEEAKARAAVKAQIEADKKARAEKAAREKALREGRPIVDAPGPSNPSPAAIAAATTGPSSERKETRLQIRMSTGGPPLTTTLPSESPLRELAEFVAAQSPDIDVDSVKFTQAFPRKTFGLSDFSKTLKELGLVPSAALVATP
ncbi:DNA-binding protein [Coprinopsis cinerea okayama7|uniref:DNA-binding protein n=1 Tax=Coprinopsis cinerea (strain Okayama-7 / 130 / ATCC MYA-4618 / FGSC 9003) TaxID=240176 RepID=A8N8T9_COPC7|nr:DNA-binding protein [Coprinopsis cinerea okayama7\|eukprot:XP_001831267.1 DNA-binding protein [Coprinopsis cinerea okayama7\